MTVGVLKQMGTVKHVVACYQAQQLNSSTLRVTLTSTVDADSGWSKGAINKLSSSGVVLIQDGGASVHCFGLPAMRLWCCWC